MKFVKLLKHVDVSFEGKPSFLLLMELDGNHKEFISNGCVFVENTEESRKKLIRKHSCEEELHGLLNSPNTDISDVRDGRYMCHGCYELTNFVADLGSLENGSCMFWGCNSLTHFEADFSSLKDGSCMFYGCKSLTHFEADFSSLKDGRGMFEGCKSLTHFQADLGSLKDGRGMFYGCDELKNKQAV